MNKNLYSALVMSRHGKREFLQHAAFASTTTASIRGDEMLASYRHLVIPTQSAQSQTSPSPSGLH
jgi:hypothetical protein